jgi:hypothetical protein
MGVNKAIAAPEKKNGRLQGEVYVQPIPFGKIA